MCSEGRSIFYVNETAPNRGPQAQRQASRFLLHLAVDQAADALEHADGDREDLHSVPRRADRSASAKALHTQIRSASGMLERLQRMGNALGVNGACDKDQTRPMFE